MRGPKFNHCLLLVVGLLVLCLAIIVSEHPTTASISNQVITDGEEGGIDDDDEDAAGGAYYWEVADDSSDDEEESFFGIPFTDKDEQEEWSRYYKPRRGYDPVEHRWNDIPVTERKKLEVMGWNEEAWESDDVSKMTFYNENEILDFDDLPDDRAAVYDDDPLRFAQRRFVNFHTSIFRRGADPSVFRAKKIKLSLPGFNQFSTSYFNSSEARNAEVGVTMGATLGHDESDVHQVSVGDYLDAMYSGNSTYYLKLEDVDAEKKDFAAVGNLFKKEIHHALKELRDYTAFPRQLQNEYDLDDFHWAMFLGAAKTSTGLHYDTDQFNCLYVVEGKKKVVVIPNDENSEGMYPFKSIFNGSAWSDANVLVDDVTLPSGGRSIILHSGEAIVIPYRWWHSVVNLEQTMSFSFRLG
ncbi:transcription factor jumonji [Seminavis robusta]|uniref:Transcription factor jumonji n=1 Tax=Seminavis robusta TaxID=568900 RepID=A0A9N8EYW4_9STRA|nr:transcription factor jumonji [Seminavis robusta]|eukprot:Sro1968_g308430.1 transcription factor jumonji (411) ;mRNA; r:11840-13072